MPPALSDEEVSDLDDFPAVSDLPARASSRRKDASSNDDEVSNSKGRAGEGSADEEDDDDDDNEGEDEDEDEDIFVVEKIVHHMIDEDGSLKFQVKWEGYEKKADMTWEPEENLEEDAHEVLDEYFERIGGRDTIFEETSKAAKGKKRGRKAGSSTGAAGNAKRPRKNGTHPAESTPPAAAKQWMPPAGSWEDEIETIDACEDEGSGKLVVYLVWKNGKKTKHDTAVVYKKCPQKMLQFYEKHVKIIREEAKEA